MAYKYSTSFHKYSISGMHLIISCTMAKVICNMHTVSVEHKLLNDTTMCNRLEDDNIGPVTIF